MKSIKLFLALALAVSTTLACSARENDLVVTFDQLPKSSQEFSSKHFNSVKVAQVVKDFDDLTYTWKVYFANGWEIEFLKGGEWKHVDCKQSDVPQTVLALLPSNVVTYCTKNYPETPIVEIDKERRGYEIELMNGLTLKFDSKGNFVRVDD